MGKEKCKSGHSYEHVFKEDFLIHYIVDGKGKFLSGGEKYDLKAGDAFLIGNKQGFYKADEKEPWTYIWINFSGTQVKEFLKRLNLSCDNPIYTARDEGRVSKCFEEFVNIDVNKNEYYIYSRFFHLLSEMLECSANEIVKEKIPSDRYVDICCEYVKFNYMKKITANDLAKVAMIEYSYLFRLFKAKFGISPGEYVINYKMRNAARLLKESDIGISETAAMVGYEDRAAFSKIFKKHYGVSPKNYKMTFMEENT